MKLMSRMVLQLYAPAALIAGGGLIAAELISRLNLHLGPLTTGKVASALFLLSILAATAWALHSSWRIYRWTLGREQRCECGGMWSRPRLNRLGQLYRKCIGCGSKQHVHAH